MNYYIKASSDLNQDAVVHIKQLNISFGTTSETFLNSAESFLGLSSACMLKDVERFSAMIEDV